MNDDKLIKPDHKTRVTNILNECVKVLDEARQDGIIVQYNISTDQNGKVSLAALEMFQKL